MRYGIGLDIGIASVGYAIIALNDQDEPIRIERLGSRIFEKAEVKKTGASLASARREARSARRRLRRHRHRLERIRGLILSSSILSKDALQALYENAVSDIYEIRTRALDARLSREEFARVLIHLAQRRGYRSNRKEEKGKDDTDGKIKEAVFENQNLCKKEGYRTIGEMFYRDEKFAEIKRNKGADYRSTVDRGAIEAEAKLIFEAQRRLGAEFATEATENEYLDILLSQRSFADGPACGPYSGNQVRKMRGACTFIPTELRAAKATYTFQLFNLWQHINHTRLIRNGATTDLTAEERKKVFDFVHEKKDVDFAKIRKLLGLPKDVIFVGLSYDGDDLAKVEKKKKIKDLETYHKIREKVEEACPGEFAKLSNEQLDAIGEALSANESGEEILKELTACGIEENVINALLSLPNFPKNGHLSLVACKKLLPFLEQGLIYNEACEKAGFNFKNDEKDPKIFLPPLPKDCQDITNPVVKRAISQTIKVINAIIREMGASPVYMNIELARELSKNFDERKEIEKTQAENVQKNENALNELKEYIPNPRPHDIAKFKLWQEQGEICLYSGEMIDVTRLAEPGYVEVDHIVPYSISFDDRMVNKVLVLARENRQKGNKLPLQYLQGKQRDDFIIRVRNSNLKHAKKQFLLKETISNEKDWKERNLNDTRHISSFMNRYVSSNLHFAPASGEKKRRVFTVNGAITDYVRKRWGIQKNRAAGDLHHAADAAVVACVTQSMINKISNYTFYKETRDYGDCIDPETGEIISTFPTPWVGFRNELEIRLNQNEKEMQEQLSYANFEGYRGVDLASVKAPFVSRMSRRKVTGAAHDATVRSAKKEEQGLVISKVELEALKLDKNGEIENYYAPESDRLLYEALKAHLKEYGKDAKAMFKKEHFHKPKSDGTPGPIVKKVKVIESTSGMVRVQNGNGIAKNGSMVRCDVFYVPNDGYYFIPIYVADTVKKKLPNLAPIQGKDKNGRKKRVEMKEENFVFSLYPNDLIRIYSKKEISVNRIQKDSGLPNKMCVPGEEGLFLYYKGLNVATAFLNAVTHDNTFEHSSIGKTIARIEKYEVDLLGTVRKVGKETRKSFVNKKKS